MTAEGDVVVRLKVFESIGKYLSDAGMSLWIPFLVLFREGVLT